MYNILTDEEVTQLFSLFKDSEKNFIRKVVTALPDIIYVMNLDTHAIVYSSRLIALEIGYTSREVEEMAHPILDILHPVDKDLYMQHLEDIKVAQPGEIIAIEYRLVGPNGKVSWFTDRNTVFTRSVKGAAVTKIGIVHEITLRKEDQTRIQKNSRIIEQTEELAESGSWEYACSSRVFSWSPGMYRLFNLPEGSIVHPAIYTDRAIPEDAELAEKIVQKIQSGEGLTNETLRVDVDGEIRCLRIRSTALETPLDGELVVVGVDVDFTSLHDKQKQLESANTALEMKNRNIHALHADLKTFTDITAVEYHTNFKNLYTAFEAIVTNEAGKFSNNGRAIIRKIQSTLQRMNLLTTDILAYLSISKDEKRIESVDLDEMTHHILSEVKNRNELNGVTIEKSVLGSITGDFHLLHILFRNVIENAIKFRKADEPLVLAIHAQREENGTTIIVEDTGVGFLAEEKELMFNLFHKNHYGVRLKGSGVGLAVAKKIMNIHGGEIRAESKSVDGAIFTCHFPKSDLSAETSLKK